MRKLLLATMMALLAGCGSAEPTVVIVTTTAPPQVITNTPTPRPPTATPRPTRTPNPTMTPEPTWEPVTVADLEAALREAGYRRFPIEGGDGLKGYSWVNKNAYERVQTWDNGTMELQVLHDKSSQVRSDHMESHLAALDSALPAGFMASLREENAAYNESVGTSVSGEPDQMFAFNDDWHTIWGQYYVSDTDIGGYGVRLSLWWWQSTCPSQYGCYYSDFPGLEFEGDSSFVFYSIFIWLPEGPT